MAAASEAANTELRQLLAQSCLWAKDYACAQEEFRQILQTDPESASAHILSGEALDGLGKTSEAIEEFQVAAKLSPHEPSVHFGIGFLYWKLHQYDDAEKEFQAELANDPNQAQALAYLGDIEWKNNHPEKALELLNRAVQNRKDIRLAYVDLGAVYTQQKQYDEAVAALRHAVELDPAQADAHYRLARLYQTLGNTAAAQKELEQVRELHGTADEGLVGKIATAPPALNESGGHSP
jgi:tetratricopeptide (TPR) repeat protein